MYGLNPENKNKNPWFSLNQGFLVLFKLSHVKFRDYWFCDKDMSLWHNNAYENYSKVQFLIDAEYAFAYALPKLKHDLILQQVFAKKKFYR